MPRLPIGKEMMLAKPEVNDVYAFLREHNALIVHFSGAPKDAGVDRGPKHLFPEDLLHVCAGRAMGGLSASVVKPGDSFHGYQRNATGCVGVVLGLKANDSLVAVHTSDGGSIEDERGNRIVQHQQDLSINDLRCSLRDRVEYNEWVIKNYSVLGIFAALPIEVSILEVPTLPEEIPDFLQGQTPVPSFRNVSINELMFTFPNIPIFRFDCGSVCKYNAKDFMAIDHDQIYKPE